MQDIWVFVDSAIALFAVVLGFFLHKLITDRKLGDTASRAERIVRDAERDAETRRRTADLEAKERALQARAAFEEETRRREREFQQIEQRIVGKEEELARKLDQLDRRNAVDPPTATALRAAFRAFEKDRDQGGKALVDVPSIAR